MAGNYDGCDCEGCWSRSCRGSTVYVQARRAEVQERLGHHDVTTTTTMSYADELNRDPAAVQGPAGRMFLP